jgi:hypothetical protein
VTALTPSPGDRGISGHQRPSAASAAISGHRRPSAASAAIGGIGGIGGHRSTEPSW